MIVKLLPEQIAQYWDAIKYGVANSATLDVKVNHGALNKVLQKLLTGTAQCWVVTDAGELKAVVVTYLNVDEMTERKNLLVYALYGFSKSSDALWQDAAEKLHKFAENEGCDTIVGYTTTELLVEKLKAFGFVKAYDVVIKVV